MSIIKANAWQNTSGTAFGTILQVKQAIVTVPVVTAATSTYVNLPGFSVTITPTSANSKFLLLANLNSVNISYTNYGGFRFSGGNSANAIGDARSLRNRNFASLGDDYGYTAQTAFQNSAFTYNMHYLDSPNTTGGITYTVQFHSSDNGTIYINRDIDDPDSTGEGYTSASTFIVMEVQA